VNSFQDTKVVIRNRNSKDRQYIQEPKKKEQTWSIKHITEN